MVYKVAVIVTRTPGQDHGPCRCHNQWGRGTAKEKIEALEGAGVVIAGSPGDVAVKIKGMIRIDMYFSI